MKFKEFCDSDYLLKGYYEELYMAMLVNEYPRDDIDRFYDIAVVMRSFTSRIRRVLAEQRKIKKKKERMN